MPDVTALATAFLAGQIHPTYSPVPFQASYMPIGQLTATGAWENCDLATTQQVANLLGGSVVMAPPPGNYQYAPGSAIPQVPWIQLGSGSLVVGDLFPPGVVLSYQDLCAAANSIAMGVPGGTVGSSCTGSGVTTPAYVYQNQVNAPTTTTNTTNVVSGSSATSGNTDPKTSAVAQTNNQTNTTNTNSGQNVSGTTPAVGGGLLAEDSLGLGLPNWGYGAIAVGILYMVMGHKR